MKYLSVLALPVFLFGCSSGSHVITGQQMPELEAVQVSVFENAPSFDYQVIGVVTASSDGGFTEGSRQEKATEELKKQAAKIGANGVILDEVTQLSFRSLGAGVGVSAGSSGGLGASIGSGFSFPTTETKGTAIYYEVEAVK
ncbi:hypothetical protein MUS1_08760 [Marinomonas ushuaiensis DSM 15871]|uniref:Lipoprotein n=1 Tax=Marinomonas ushuaiensis DSM 15871 TaxID=1122207 RepID=X7E2S7_9GAMM|nr:hypothetical protein MUS1_08760 [Marinomonas ushuaiensis DSM 15871]